jgi:hypothetical protein
MDFGDAIRALKEGKRVARAGWNGKGMWLAHVTSYNYLQGEATTQALGLELLPWVGMKTADQKFVPWLASQTDILSEDWVVVD